MPKVTFDNKTDPSTGHDVSSNLSTVLDELRLLIVLFGNLPGMIVEPDDIMGGVEALLYDMRNRLSDVNHKIFHCGEEGTA